MRRLSALRIVKQLTFAYARTWKALFACKFTWSPTVFEFSREESLQNVQNTANPYMHPVGPTKYVHVTKRNSFYPYLHLELPRRQFVCRTYPYLQRSENNYRHPPVFRILCYRSNSASLMGFMNCSISSSPTNCVLPVFILRPPVGLHLQMTMFVSICSGTTFSQMQLNRLIEIGAMQTRTLFDRVEALETVKSEMWTNLWRVDCCTNLSS